MTQIIWDSDPKANYEDCLAKTRYYLDHALASNPENDLAHILYGFTHMFFEQDFETARRFFLKGLELRPSSFNKQLVASTFLNALGELEFADSLLTQAMAESPLDPGVSAGRALVDFFAGRILQARQTLNTNIKLIKEGNSTSVAARIYFGLQDYQQVISILTEYLAERPEKRPPLILAYLAAAYYKVGEVTEVNKLLRELKEIHLHTKIGSPAFYTALVYSQMGEVDIAFELLDKAISNREIELYWLKVESPFEPLREDHRWQDALDAVGFPKKI